MIWKNKMEKLDKLEKEQSSLHFVVNANQDFKTILSPPCLNKKNSTQISQRLSSSQPIKAPIKLKQKFPTPLQKSFLLDSIGIQKKKKFKISQDEKLGRQLIRTLSLIFLSECEGYPNTKYNSNLSPASVHRVTLPSLYSSPYSLKTNTSNDTLQPFFELSQIHDSNLRRQSSLDSYFFNIPEASIDVHPDKSSVKLYTIEDSQNYNIQPSIHTFPNQLSHMQNFPIDMDFLASSGNHSNESSKAHLILIPSQDKDGNHRELLQKVYSYPDGAIKTIVEKTPHKMILSEKDDPILKTTVIKHKGNFKIKKVGSVYSSSRSIGSSLGSSQPSSSNIYYNVNSLPQSSLTSNGNSTTLINSLHPPKINLEYENLSDTSSNLSTCSDLSGYDSEYSAIRRVISDAPFTHKDQLSVFKSTKKKSSVDSKLVEQDALIRSLQTCNEDLEIQSHRLTVQLQNAIREKETCLEQVEIIQTKLIENNQIEYYQALKDKATIEGQYDTLKMEFENYSVDKNLLEAKVFDLENKLLINEQGTVRSKKIQNDLENSNKDLEITNKELKAEVINLSNELVQKREILGQLEMELEGSKHALIKSELLISNYKAELSTFKENYEKLLEQNLDLLSKDAHNKEVINHLESKVSESFSQIGTLKEELELIQTQFHLGQKHQTDLQLQLTDTKSSLSVLSSERDRCKSEMDRLEHLIEENRARAVREKSALLVQLEELEADMKEREAAMQQNKEENTVNLVTVDDDRLKKLEEDHEKLQKFRIKIGDYQRENESLIDELRHKNLVQRKNEDKIRDLRRELVITQEKIGEKEVSIASMVSHLQDSKLKIENYFYTFKEKDKLIGELKEDKLNLETILNVANEDKNQVDITITKLKEDMNKLTSNYYRMKHDIVAKDRQIESIRKENLNFININNELNNKLQNLYDSSEQKEKIAILESEIDTMKQDWTKVNDEKNHACEEVNILQKSLKTFSIEKNNAVHALKLRDEQISNLQSGMEAYKEKLLQKDEEIFKLKDQAHHMEESYRDLMNKSSSLDEQLIHLQNDKEDSLKGEIILRKAVADLKESLKLEKGAKETFEKKHRKVLSDITSLKADHKNQLCKLDQSVDYFKNEYEKVKLSYENEMEIYTEAIKVKEKQIQELNLKNAEISELSSENDLIKNKLIEENKLMKLTIADMETKRIDEVLILESEIAKKNSELKKYLENPRISNDIDAFNNPATAAKPSISSDANVLNYNSTVEKPSRYKSKLKRNFKKEDKKLAPNELLNISDFKTKDEKILQLNLRLCNQRKEIEASLLENSTLKESLATLNEKVDSLQEELNQFRTNIVLKERECDDWKLKYERLCDFIPQRDTSTKQAVALHYEQYQTFNNMHYARQNSPVKFGLNEIVSKSITSLENLDVSNQIRPSENFTSSQIEPPYSSFLNSESNISPSSPDQNVSLYDNSAASLMFPPSSPPIEKKEEYSVSHTVSDWQNQLILTESLSKDMLIGQLQYHDKEVQTQTDDCLPSPLPSATMVSDVDTLLNEKEIQMNDLSSKISEQNNKISDLELKLEQKENEFRDRQRRYESNIRLLTRKLKEHMKGRRVSERDLETLVEENKRKMEGDEKQYNLLKERLVEMEGQCQNLESEKSRCERSRLDVIRELSEIKEKFENQQSFNIELQKDLGQIEELKGCLNSSKLQLTSLEMELRQQSLRNIENLEKLQKTESEKCLYDNQCKELLLNVEHSKKSMKNLNEEIIKKEKLLKLQEEKISSKCLEISSLNEEVVALRTQLGNLENSLISKKDKELLLLKEIETLKMEIDRLTYEMQQKDHSLVDFVSKKKIWEEEIKLKEASSEMMSQEVKELKVQIKLLEENHASSVALLNTKLIGATEIENSLNERLRTTLEQKLFYQAQTTEFRSSLNSALSQLRGRGNNRVPVPIIPSPSPLDTTSLLKLMERCSEPPSSMQCFNSLTQRVKTLREEVSVLQQEIIGDQEMLTTS